MGGNLAKDANPASIGDDRADRFALVHEVETIVDSIERQDVGDQVVDVDLAVHVPIDDPRNVGAAAGTAKRGALPYPAGDKLERPGADFLAGASDPDDHGDAPAAVAALQRLAHHVDVADTLEGVVGTATGELHQMWDEIALDVLRIDEVRHSEFSRERLAGRVEVDADDHVGTGHSRPLDD